MKLVNLVAGDDVAMETQEDAALKRLALQIVAQLPESPELGLRVLEHAKTLVRSFLTV